MGALGNYRLHHSFKNLQGIIGMAEDLIKVIYALAVYGVRHKCIVTMPLSGISIDLRGQSAHNLSGYMIAFKRMANQGGTWFPAI